jgi:hypothetical protein
VCSTTDTGGELDNYANIPINIAGFTMHDQDPLDIIDESASDVEYAEVLCYAGLDIVAVDGASAVGDTSGKYVDAYGKMLKVLHKLKYNVAKVSDIKNTKRYAEMGTDGGNALNCYWNAETETLTPAPLEPVVPSFMPQIATVAIPPVQMRMHLALTCLHKLEKLEAGVVMTSGGCNFYTKKTASCPTPKK